MKLNRTTAYLLSAIVFVVAMTAANVLFSFYIENQSEVLTERQQAVADEQALVSERAQIRSVLEDTTEERAELARYILDGDDDTAAFLSDIDDIAERLVIELSTKQLEVSEEEGDFDVLTVSFDVSGTESAVRTLLQMFETLPYVSEVTVVSLQRSFDPLIGIRSLRGSVTIELSITNL